MLPRFTPREFQSIWVECGGSPAIVSKRTGMPVRSVFKYRASLAKKGIVLNTVTGNNNKNGANGFGPAGWQIELSPYRARADYRVRDGNAVFFGDAHYHPGEPSIAHQALLLVCKKIKPIFIAANGDIVDGASISRHEPLGWGKLPTVAEELDIVRTRMGEIERATPNADRFYSPGNHCTRLDRRLATEVPEFGGMPGFRLEDHIRGWPMAYVGVINADTDIPVLVMHNFRGGVHATWNNVLHAGTTIVTGHLHAQDMKAQTNYFKTYYGVDHGTLADPGHAAFSYTMGRPTNWRSGFCVIPFDKRGRHYPPEFCTVQRFKDGSARAVFRGETIIEQGPKSSRSTNRRGNASAKSWPVSRVFAPNRPKSLSRHSA